MQGRGHILNINTVAHILMAFHESADWEAAIVQTLYERASESPSNVNAALLLMARDRPQRSYSNTEKLHCKDSFCCLHWLVCNVQARTFEGALEEARACSTLA